MKKAIKNTMKLQQTTQSMAFTLLIEKERSSTGIRQQKRLQATKEKK